VTAKIKTVIFDLDGTVVDVPYDWSRIKEELGTEAIPILSYLAGLKEPEKSQKWKMLEKFERDATEKAVLKKGMPGLFALLTERGIKKALVTNNSQKNTSFLLDKFKLEFDCVISRERGLWKPSAAPFLAVLEELGINKEASCVVGDTHFDIKAAKEAGITKIFILNKDKEKFAEASVEVLESVEELRKRIEEIL